MLIVMKRGKRVMKEKKNSFFSLFYFFIIEANKRKFELVSFFLGRREAQKEEDGNATLPLLLPQRMGFAYFVHSNK